MGVHLFRRDPEGNADRSYDEPISGKCWKACDLPTGLGIGNGQRKSAFVSLAMH